jgi:hypothetical protein
MKTVKGRATFQHDHLVKQIAEHEKAVDAARSLVKRSRQEKRRLVNEFITFAIGSIQTKFYYTSERGRERDMPFWGGLVCAASAGLKWAITSYRMDFVSDEVSRMRIDRVRAGRRASDAIRECHELDTLIFEAYPVNRRCELFTVDWDKFNKMLDNGSKG